MQALIAEILKSMAHFILNVLVCLMLPRQIDSAVTCTVVEPALRRRQPDFFQSKSRLCSSVRYARPWEFSML
ncbi:uncharacterized protein BJ212DRAFT_1409534 [Suillus subaureus]|uniref:Secreted protein n=1 Tax=Suillus subaureus TaxID=48587 RepID=A0A9P7ASX5_9AGAM|nr:uncharacterized protein BJ212DRAFT_1409534 [Suillus subaureus]KAG1795917.1 hypothetical protein BJ212DRAFT_1409534 [Suillus subaureus]